MLTLSHIRLLPDFIIIGAQRCGTTSLYNYLAEHPMVAPASRKEIHFFDKNFHRGIAWYKFHFPSSVDKYYTRFVSGGDLITGEASPYYIFHPLAPRRIFQLIPDVKLIALLRNPVDRAYSHYHHAVGAGLEPLSFGQAIECETERLAGVEETFLENEEHYSADHQYHSYLTRGIYIDQLKVWMGLFPSERILVIKSEDFYMDPASTLKRVLRFLDLPNWEPTEYKRFNYSTYPPMDVALRERLCSFFRPHNERLYSYLGIDFGWDR